MATRKKSMYAWTDIKHGDKTIKAGDSVSQSDFSDEDWEQLLESRAIRTNAYPEMPADFGGSPREWMVKQVNSQLEAAEDMLSDDDVLAAERSADAEVEDE